MKIPPIFLLLILSAGTPAMAQKGRTENLEGNQLYTEKRYQEALDKYTQGLKKAPDSPIIRFNAGDAHYRLEKFQEALQAYNQMLQTEDEQIKSQALYNLGNAFYRLGKYQESVEAYKESLRLNPEDHDAKFNLEKALRELQMNPPQQSQDQQKSEDQKDEDQRKSDPSGEDQRDDKNAGQHKQEQQEPGQPEEASSQQPEGSASQLETRQLPMTKQQAEQLLQALEEDQGDFLGRRVAPVKPRVGEKDW